MRLSYSALNTYQTCPLKYKFQYIDKIRKPKSKEAVFGTLIHSTLNFIHTPGILSPSLEQALDFFSKNWNSDVFDKEVEERAAFSQGVEIIKRYYKDNDISKINIIALESPFQIKIGEHIASGIIDRIDRTEYGYEIIDYKTSKKMPSQQKVDNDLQLTIYLKAFLDRYPEEKKRLNKIKVSLYFVKHGVKLSSIRNKKQLDILEENFLEAIRNIENSSFKPILNPLCDWCDFQEECPMQKHKFKEKRKIDSEEINKDIKDYIQAQTDAKSLRMKISELQKKISDYMDQEGVERVFSEQGVITRNLRQTFSYDEKKLKEVLEPLGKWEEVNKINLTQLKKVLSTLPSKIKRDIESTKKLERESKGFSVKKK